VLVPLFVPKEVFLGGFRGFLSPYSPLKAPFLNTPTNPRQWLSITDKFSDPRRQGDKHLKTRRFSRTNDRSVTGNFAVPVTTAILQEEIGIAVVVQPNHIQSAEV